jgi:hypothetical protein
MHRAAAGGKLCVNINACVRKARFTARAGNPIKADPSLLLKASKYAQNFLFRKRILVALF